MYRHLKKYMIFIVGAFVCSLFLVLAFTTDRKNDNSVNAKAEAAYNQTTTAFIDSIGETARPVSYTHLFESENQKISDQIQSETDKLLAKVLDDASNLMTNRFSMSD